MIEAGRQEGIFGFSWVLDENSCFLEEKIGSEKGVFSLYHYGTRVSEIPPRIPSLSDSLISCTVRNQHLLTSCSVAGSVI